MDLYSFFLHVFLLCTIDLEAVFARSKCSLPKLKNGRVRIRGRGRMVYFRCNKGYGRLGAKFAVCLQNKVWSQPTPTCVTGRGCKRVQTGPNVKVKRLFRGGILKFSCAPGLQRQGPETISCDGVSWSDNPPKCLNKLSTGCDFEDPSNCGWNHDSSADFDWKRGSGETPTANTGPKVDHTFQNASGHYMFMESSAPRNPSDQARFMSPQYLPHQVTGFCLEFYYHMYGPPEPGEVGELAVSLQSEAQGQDGADNSLFFKSGNQDDKWQKADVIIPKQTKPFVIVFQATRLVGWTSDIAIDDIRLYNCSGRTTTQTTPTTTTTTTTTEPTTTTSSTTTTTTRRSPKTQRAPKHSATTTTPTTTTNTTTTERTTKTSSLSTTTTTPTTTTPTTTPTTTTTTTTTTTPTTATTTTPTKTTTTTTTTTTTKPTTTTTTSSSSTTTTTPKTSATTSTTTTTSSTTKLPLFANKTSAQKNRTSPRPMVSRTTDSISTKSSLNISKSTRGSPATRPSTKESGGIVNTKRQRQSMTTPTPLTRGLDGTQNGSAAFRTTDHQRSKTTFKRPNDKTFGKTTTTNVQPDANKNNINDNNGKDDGRTTVVSVPDTLKPGTNKITDDFIALPDNKDSSNITAKTEDHDINIPSANQTDGRGQVTEQPPSERAVDGSHSGSARGLLPLIVGVVAAVVVGAVVIALLTYMWAKNQRRKQEKEDEDQLNIITEYVETNLSPMDTNLSH